MFSLLTVDCPDGFAYVKDYQGNKIFYGRLEECKKCIKDLTGKKGVKKYAVTRSKRNRD